MNECPLTSDERSIIENAAVPDTDCVFFLGCFEKRVTFYAQQVRALNLAHALLSENIVRPTNGKVAVIGGGLAGITVAAAFATAAPEITVVIYESSKSLLNLQKGAGDRFVHPHIFDWPESVAGSKEADLPLLNWEAGFAKDIVEKLNQEFKSICRTSEIEVRTGKKVTGIKICDRIAARVETDTDAPSDPYDVVILSIGFGLEREISPQTNPSYWSPSILPAPLINSKEECSIFVSGNGDGGLTDFALAAFDGSDHQKILLLVTEYPRLEQLREELLKIDDEAWETDGLDIFAEYESRLTQLVPRSLWLDISNLLRPNIKIIFHTREKNLFRRDTAVLSRFIAFLIITADRKFKSYRIEIVKGVDFSIPPENRSAVCLPNRPLFEPQIRMLRFGPNTEVNMQPFLDLEQCYQQVHGNRLNCRPTTPFLLPRARERWTRTPIPPTDTELLTKERFDISNLGSAVDKSVFKGRDTNIQAIGEWFGDVSPRGWVIHGMPGQGKSELACRFAYEHHHKTGDRVVAVSLYKLGGVEQLIEKLASILHESTARRADEQVKQILTFCRGHKILIIIDGLEREQDSTDAPLGAGVITSGLLRDLLIGLLSPESQARLLITSRLDVSGIDPLGVLKSELLPALTPEDGRDLLRSLGAVESNNELEEISIRLGGHPLSLTAAVPILRKYGAHSFPRLTRGISDDKRIRRVMFRFQESLSQEASMLIYILAASAGPLSETVMQMILCDRNTAPLTSQSLESARNECTGMVWKGLNGSLDVHPIVREIFQQEWIKRFRSKAKAIHGTLANFFETQARGRISAGSVTLTDLKPALAAIHHRLMRGEVELAGKLKYELIDQGEKKYLTRILGAWGVQRDHSWMFFYDHNPEKPHKGIHPLNIGILLLNIGYAETRLGQIEKALRLLDHSHQMLKKRLQKAAPDEIVDYLFTISMCLASSVDCLGMLGRFEDAERKAEEDIAMWDTKSFSSLGITYIPPTAMYDCLPKRACVKLWRGNFDSAVQDFSEAMKYLNLLQPPRAVLAIEYARCHIEALLLVNMSANLTDAISIYNKSMELPEAHWREEMIELKILGASLARLDGRSEEALTELANVYNEIAMIETVEVRIRCNLELARCYLQLNQQDDAYTYAQCAFDLAGKIKNLILQFDSLALLAEAECASQKKQALLEKLKEAVYGIGYRRRQRDLECLMKNGRPVIEFGL